MKALVSVIIVLVLLVASLPVLAQDDCNEVWIDPVTGEETFIDCEPYDDPFSWIEQWSGDEQGNIDVNVNEPNAGMHLSDMWSISADFAVSFVIDEDEPDTANGDLFVISGTLPNRARHTHRNIRH